MGKAKTDKECVLVRVPYFVLPSKTREEDLCSSFLDPADFDETDSKVTTTTTTTTRAAGGGGNNPRTDDDRNNDTTNNGSISSQPIDRESNNKESAREREGESAREPIVTLFQQTCGDDLCVCESDRSHCTPPPLCTSLCFVVAPTPDLLPSAPRHTHAHSRLLCKERKKKERNRRRPILLEFSHNTVNKGPIDTASDANANTTDKFFPSLI